MYEKSVERANPGCIVFLVDQSFSMMDSFAGSSKPKCEAVATAINRFLSELISNCEKGEEKPRHYFDVSVIGYTTDGDNRPIIGSVLGGLLAGRDIVSVIDLYENPLDVEVRQKDDGVGGLIEIRLPIWYRMPAQTDMRGTPMCAALQYCHSFVQHWCITHPTSFPPVIIHLTDGESTDGNPEDAAEALKTLSTQDGNLLLFNCHLSSSDSEAVLFPANEYDLPNDDVARDFSRLLFRMSSPLPEKMRRIAEAKSIKTLPGARGMAFNADGVKMLQLIQVGTVIASAQSLGGLPTLR